jgi:hypothetical protein
MTAVANCQCLRPLQIIHRFDSSARVAFPAYESAVTTSALEAAEKAYTFCVLHLRVAFMSKSTLYAERICTIRFA